MHEVIVSALSGVDDCAAVTDADLASLTSLDMTSQNIASLKSGDFAGLTSLTVLGLGRNSFTMLPADVFSGLTALTDLLLGNNSLESLPGTVFSSLTALTNLRLNNNALESLPADVFSGLTALTSLVLNENSLESLPGTVFSSLTSLTTLEVSYNELDSLPGTVFSGLTALTFLDLQGNDLDSLPGTVFSSLTALTTLRLQGNDLDSLPDGVFSGLTALTSLRLSDNNLNALPDGVFSGLTALATLSLGGNPTDPLPFTVTVEKVGTNQVRAKVLAGAPFAVDIPVTVVDGTLAAGATMLRVAAGAVEGTAVTVTRTAGTTAAVTVDVDLSTPPTLPRGHTGYAFAKATTGLPATILPDPGASSDAMLSDLVVNDGNANLTLTPTFASDMYTYRASVTNDVAEVTVTAMTTDSGATIEYLDGDDATLTDADTSDPGHQVAVVEGDNVVKVKVTAVDGNATQTYMVTVNRATAMTCTLNTGDRWCGVVTVGAVSVPGIGPVSHGFTPSVGALSDTGLRVGTNSYTIDSVITGAGNNAGVLQFSLTSDLTAADKAKLVLHIDGSSDTFAFSAAGGPSSSNTYDWERTGLDWSSESTVTLRLRDTAADADAPGVEGQFRLAPETVDDYADDTLGRLNGHVGRAEVFHAERWGTVSDDGLLRTGNEASALVCQAMDYDTGEFASGYGQPGVPSQPFGLGITKFYPVGSTYPPDGPLPIWLDDLSCVSGDTDLTGVNALKPPMAHCGYAGWGLHNSTHSEDAGVRCWNELESDAGRSYDPLTAAFEGLPEAHDGETAFSFRLAFSEAVAVTPEAMRTRALTVAGGAVTGAARVDGESGVWEITVTPDSREDLSITLAPAEDCEAEGAVCTSDGRTLSAVPAHIVPGPGPETEPALTASFEGLPEVHDGEEGFHFRVAFSEEIGIGFRSMRDDSFTVDGGEVTAARRVDGRHDLWRITVEPDSDEDVAIALPGGRECAVSGAICTRGENRRQLANTPTATVAGPPERNTAATGAPTISGTAQVGEELTASTSGISDADGLDDARFGYQWMRADADIGGATGSTYTPVAADEGERLKVRVSFTDDAGNEESLTSAATDAVAAAPEPLTAAFEGMPAEHRGQGSFSFRVAFSEGISISYKTVRDASFTVTGGDVTRARRVDKRRDLWKITIEPNSDGAVTVRLPETTDCGASGAICTGDGRRLSHALSATVAGPVGIAVADARVEEGADAVLAFAVTLSRAASAALTVDYATADGSAHAGDDYRAASGTLTFGAGESSTTIEVAVLDDAHDEGEETLTLRLSNPSGGRLADGEATGTIENHDPMPRALLARFGRTAAVHVVEHVEERLQAPRAPGFRGRFAGRELRRGMERDIALNFLRQLGGMAGATPAGAGVHGSLSGAPAAGTAPLGMPGPAGGGGHLAAASGPIGGAMPMGGAPGARGMAASPMGGGSRPDGGFNGGGLLRMGLGGGDVLTGSDFALGRETGHGGILSFWSRGAQSRFSGREGALSLGGDVRTTMVGADYAKGPVVTGLSLSHSRGLGEYAGVAGGQVASSVTGLYPWLGYKATDRVTVWGVAGYGAGGLRLTPQGGPALESGLSMAMAAAGTRGELVSGGAGGFALAFKADALWVGTSIDGVDGPAGRLKATEAAVTRFRTGLEGSRAYTIAGRLSLTPSVEVGLRHDGGDAETGAGMDVGLGLVVSDSSTGLAVDVRVRTLLVHQAEGFSERGVALSLSYNPTPSTPLGLTAKVAPSWGGQATSGAEALWGQETMGGMAHGGLASGNRLDGEVGYGLPVGRRFVGTPTLGVGTSADGRDYRLGYRLGALGGAGTAFELGVEAHRRERPMLDTADNGFLGRATVAGAGSGASAPRRRGP